MDENNSIIPTKVEPVNNGHQRADYATRFKSGNSGRPKGAKNKSTQEAEQLRADVINAVNAAFHKRNGRKWILKVFEKNPQAALDLALQFAPPSQRLDVSGEVGVTHKKFYLSILERAGVFDNA